MSIELRIASGARDQAALRELAALDDARALGGEVLLALVDGEPVAAVSLLEGRVVANPFVPTAAVVAVLQLRAEQLRAEQLGRRERLRRRPGRLRHPRLAL